MSDPNLGDSITEEKTVVTSCPHDCGGKCVLKIHVKDGKITKIQSDEGEEPQLRACQRGRAYRQRVYSADRLKFPMERTGARGDAKFERISWNQALDKVASELRRIKETYGCDSILYHGYSGNLGTFLHSKKAVSRLLNMFGGCVLTTGSASFEGSIFSSKITYGTLITGHTRDDLLNSRLIIMWGWNPAETVQCPNTCFYLAQAKEAGAKIVSVDPRFTDSAAAFANQWIPIRPNTDTAMLIAMAWVIINRNLHDRKFLETYTVGFNTFKNYVLGIEDDVPKTPGWAESITGVPAAIIENLASEYATSKPAALLTFGAPGRSAYGEQFHRAASTLAAMTGNIGVYGGEPAGAGIQPVGLPFTLAPRLDDGVNPVKTTVHISEIWNAILEGKKAGYPKDIKMFYVTNANPLNQLLNTNKGVEALRKLEFVVVHEQFMTATAKFADILLPVNTHLERNDIVRPWVTGPYYIYLNKAINSMYESKSDLEICSELATRLKIKGYNDNTEDEWLRGMWKSAEKVALNKPLPNYDVLKNEGVHKIKLLKPAIAFKEQIEVPRTHPFPTPSGKIEIYSEQLADMKNPRLPPIPKYIEAWESPNNILAKTYPLQFVSTHSKKRVHSTMDNIPWLREIEPPALWINTSDACSRRIKNGDMVKVFNERGAVVIAAQVTERIMQGVVSMDEGMWFNPDVEGTDFGGCANVLTKDVRSPGGAFCSNTCLVQIEKFGE